MLKYFMFMLFFIPLALLAQDSSVTAPILAAVEVFDPFASFLSIPALSAAVLFLTELYKNFSQKNTQIVSWVIAVLTSGINNTFFVNNKNFNIPNHCVFPQANSIF